MGRPPSEVGPGRPPRVPGRRSLAFPPVLTLGSLGSVFRPPPVSWISVSSPPTSVYLRAARPLGLLFIFLKRLEIRRTGRLLSLGICKHTAVTPS